MSGIFKNVYAGKKVMVTGHTGFKGTWLSLWLRTLGAKVTGYALPPNTEPSIFKATGLGGRINSLLGDIRDSENLERVIQETRPEIIFHLAAQPIVSLSYQYPKVTYETNIMGTINLLEAVRKTDSIRVVVVITSDKCYDNREWVYGYRENDPLGGYDPYSSSKAGTELVVKTYQKCFFDWDRSDQKRAVLASARVGNVIGGGDWAQDRIVPDAVRALAAGEPIVVRNPYAIRPWQHVLEPLSGYLWLGALLWNEGQRYASAWNFGPNDVYDLSVGSLADAIINNWGSGSWHTKRHNIESARHEANYLKLDCSKARSLLGWEPVYRNHAAVTATVEWYKEFYAGNSDLHQLTLAQIKAYAEKARQLGLAWTGEDDGDAALS